MPDIFLSYARLDEIENGRVRPIAESLKAMGYDVFWDANIPAGRDFIEYLEQQLENAKCVIVVWSENSRKSFWVREEAASGRDRHILVPLTLDGTIPPLGFRSIQSITLEDWDGSLESDHWKKLISSIEQILPIKPRPGADRVTSASPWHLVWILDDSGSMAGPTAAMINASLDYMVEEMQLLSKGTKPYFFISIVTYGSKTEILLEKVPVDKIETGRAFVSGNGGTCNVADALRLTRNLLQRSDAKVTDFTPYVFLLCGGWPDDAQTAILAASAVKELTLPPGSPKIVAVSIGYDTDLSFMKLIASSREFHVTLDEPHKIVRFMPAIGTIGGSSGSAQQIERAITKL